MANLQSPGTSHPEESFGDFYLEVNTIFYKIKIFSTKLHAKFFDLYFFM